MTQNHYRDRADRAAQRAAQLTDNLQDWRNPSTSTISAVASEAAANASLAVFYELRANHLEGGAAR